MNTLGNTYSVEVNRTNREDWHKYLRNFCDASIYQSWGYGAAKWGERNLSHMILKSGEETVGLAQLRIVRMPTIRLGVAYLRWGPVFHRHRLPLNAEALRELVEALRKEYVQSKGYALRILPNAFARTPRAEMFTSALEQAGFRAARNSSVYRTLVLDLSPTLDELRRQLNPKWRNKLNQAERNNLSISEGSDPQLWGAFEVLYRDMMARKRFETTVSIKEFAAIQKTLPPELKMQVLICKRDGVPIAGLVCSFLGDAGIYLLGATNGMALKLRAANLLQWTVVKKLKQEGFRYYDLGGIDPVANPGGFDFKQGLSGQDLSQLPAFDYYRSVSQRWVLKVAFGAADLLRVWKIRRHKKEVSVN